MDRNADRRWGKPKDTHDVALDKIGDCVLLPSGTDLLPVETTPHPCSDQETQGLHAPPMFSQNPSHVTLPFPDSTSFFSWGWLTGPFSLFLELGLSRARDEQCLVPHTPERASRGCQQPRSAAELAFPHSSPLSPGHRRGRGRRDREKGPAAVPCAECGVQFKR